MKVHVVDERKREIREPYVVRMGGWTLERYLAESPDNARWEYVRGEVIMYSPATAEHQRLVGFLYRLLQGYCEAKGWGEVLTGPAAVQLAPEVVREPDVFILAPEDALRAKGAPLPLRPVLVVEVISPSTRSLDLGEKAHDYAEAGVPEYWAVDPQRKEFYLHRPVGEGEYRVQTLSEGKVESAAVPGLWMWVDWLWRSPLPAVAPCLEEVLRRHER